MGYGITLDEGFSLREAIQPELGTLSGTLTPPIGGESC